MKHRSDYVERMKFRCLRQPRLNRTQNRKIQALERKLDSECQFARERTYFYPYARRGLGDGQMTIIGDVREIPLLSDSASSAMEYRLSSFAQTGDIVVLQTVRYRDFEDYREKTLQLGSPDYLETSQPTVENLFSTPVRCLKDKKIYSELLKRVRSLQATTVLSHIATGTIWALARRLGAELDQPMQVAGALPTLSRLANNKLWFAKVVSELLGPEVIPDEVPVHGPAALTGAVRSLARKNNKLVIKVPDSAGSAGNFVISCSILRDMDVYATHRFLAELLVPVEKELRFPLMVQVWENKVLMSPSIQIWIPKAQDGSPIIEGFFEQVLSGPSGTFSGAAHVVLPPELDERMACQGMMLAQLFQSLGYFGRCSFDSVISGDDLDSAKLLWIECNGRWGGVSVPMTLLNNLFRNSQIPEFVIYHAPGATGRRQTFAEGSGKLKELLWSPGRASGVIFLTPSGFETGEKLHFVSLASTIKQAQQQVELTLRRLAEDY